MGRFFGINMKTLAIVLAAFFVGFFSALFLARYASPVEAYGQRLRAQHGLEEQAYDDYQERRYASAAGLLKGSSLLGADSLDEWEFWLPIRGSIYRARGGLENIDSLRGFNSPLIAYLFRVAGDEAAAKPYYDSVERDKHKTQAELDKFAKSYMDQLGAMDRSEVKRALQGGE
jgi:hypothetical protein